MTKYFVKGFNGRVDMGVTRDLMFSIIGYDDKGRVVLRFETAHLESEFHVHENNIKIQVNHHNKTVNNAIDRIFDNIDDVKSIKIIGEDNELTIQVLMSR